MKKIFKVKNYLQPKTLSLLTSIFILITINANAEYKSYESPCKTDYTKKPNVELGKCQLESCRNGDDYYSKEQCEVLAYCIDYPRTEEFKKLKSFKLSGYRFYYNDKDKKIKYVNVMQYLDNQWEEVECIQNHNHKIKSLDDLLKFKDGYYYDVNGFDCDTDNSCGCENERFRIYVLKCNPDIQYDQS